MSRPRYESNKDRKSEAEVAAYLKKAMNLDCVKMPLSYRVDFIVYRLGKLFGFIELKTRSVNRQRYKTAIISLSKWHYGCRLSECLDVPFWIAFRWSNDLGFYRATCLAMNITVQQGGRTDRGDKDDIEPVVHIPVKEFTSEPTMG